MRVRNMNDLMLGIALLLVAAFLFQETFFFPPVQSFSFGPRVLPRIILGVIGFCSLLLIVQNLAFDGKSPEKKGTGRTIDMPVLVMRFGMIFLLVTYVAVLPLVGYLPGTCVFLFLTMLLLGLRTPKHLALYAVVSVIVAFSLQYIFGTLLRFFLP